MSVESASADLEAATLARMESEGVTMDIDPAAASFTPPANKLNPLEAFAAQQSGELPSKPAVAETPAETPAPASPPETPVVEEPAAELPDLPDLPAETAAAPAKYDDFLSYAKEKDPTLYGDFQSTDALLDSHTELRRKMGEKSDMERLGELAWGNAERFVEVAREQGKLPPQGPPPGQEETQAPQVQAPKSVDDQVLGWMKHIDKDSMPEAMQAEVVTYFQNRQVQNSQPFKELQQQHQELLQKVNGAAETAVTAEQVTQQTQQQIAAQTAHSEDHRVASEFIQSNRDKLFVNGSYGQPTPMGAVVFAEINDAHQHGYDVPQQIARAKAKAHSHFANVKPTVRPNAAAAENRPDPVRVTPESGERLIRPGETMADSILRQLEIKQTDAWG